MEKNDLINLWNEGNQKMLQTKNLDRSELEAFIKPKINKATLGLNFNILFYMAVLIATMILIGIDLYGYRSNPTMLKVLMPMLILSSAFFGYGVFMISNIFQINRNDVDLMACIKKKLKIYRTHCWAICSRKVCYLWSVDVDDVPGLFISNIRLKLDGGQRPGCLSNQQTRFLCSGQRCNSVFPLRGTKSRPMGKPQNRKNLSRRPAK